MKSCIKAVSYAFPEKKLSNQDLAMLYPDWSVEKIAGKTGIAFRHIASEDQFSLELAELAAKKLFSDYEVSTDKIDFVIFCTQTPKYLLPTGACVLQSKLGLRNDVGAFDINLGCSGYIYALSVAHGLIQSGQAKSILLLTADTYTKLINPENRQLRTIFGDGASATLLEAQSDGAGIAQFSFYTDGTGYDKLIAPMSGVQGLMCNKPYQADLTMIGPDIFNFTIKCIPALVDAILLKNALSIADIDYCIFHQANSYMLSYLREKCGFTEEQFIIDMENYGNTVSSSIPIVLSNLFSTKKMDDSKTILLLGFGVGLSCAGTVIKR
ncbi:MAG: ketoacyl-ACP synthase III [Gammaproteobacteria bacterium]|nr:ketoacyl-ACP synthase III [Gammaproteobacteria bacterium]